MQRWIYLLIVLVSFIYRLEAKTPLKLLHLTFHRSCLNEIEAIGKELGLDVEHWFIPDLPPQYLDGVSKGNALYNIDHERAERIWKKHHKLFDEFDAVLVSDTAPLSRIFLQNRWKKPLIIWICNRFDYSDVASLDCHFPDEEYYELFNQAAVQDNVTVIAYTAFEHYYAKSKGVDTGNLLIPPCCPQIKKSPQSSIPLSIEKKDSFFLPPYHNELYFMDLSQFCTALGIKNYCGRYNGVADLQDFRGIIHLPYTWSSFAFFECLQLGIPYLIPTVRFFEECASKGNYFHPNLGTLLEQKLFPLSEWYAAEHQDFITYFDSWEDLQIKIQETNFSKLREKIKAFGKEHKARTLDQWRAIFDKITNQQKIISSPKPLVKDPFVVGRLVGQLGNQFFIIAATLNLALSHNATAFFPDFLHPFDPKYRLEQNYKNIFFRLNAAIPPEEIRYYYGERGYTFSPIAYHDNIELRGWFQSEKYFLEHKKEILEFFSPSPQIMAYLRKKYAAIIDHPKTVSIHVRSYLKEDPEQKVYISYDTVMDYYKKAISLFPEDTLFVVFSCNIEECKSLFKGMAPNVCFIEGEADYHDLYLMSLCKDNIICNSTFSWWGAYLNKNPAKRVIAPPQWFSEEYGHDTSDLIPASWTILSY
jgi:hypothetical protein